MRTTSEPSIGSGLRAAAAPLEVPWKGSCSILRRMACVSKGADCFDPFTCICVRPNLEGRLTRPHASTHNANGIPSPLLKTPLSMEEHKWRK